MGQPRSTRRKVVAESSDEGEDEPTVNLASASRNTDNGDKEETKPAKGKLKSIRRSSTRQPTPASSLQSEVPPQSSGKAPKAKTKDSDLNTSPGKAKSTTRTRSKAIAQEEPKAKSKPIYSFFNAATQRQQSSQRSASPLAVSTPLQDIETIDSDDGDAASIAPSKGSSVALAMRKRKPQDREDEANLLPPPTQKFRKTSDSGRAPSISVANKDKRSWVIQFGPANLDELAVHKRKVGDVRNWLEAAYNGKRQRVLVLKGAAGTGKTTTIELLAKDMGAHVTEWKNPAGSDLTSEGSMSASLQFEDFVGRAGRSGGLSLAVSGREDAGDQHLPKDSGDENAENGRQLLLIEEFPNTFSKTSPALQSFRSAISQYLASPLIANGPPTPIVLVISETLLSTSTAAADSFTVHRLLGPELLQNPWLDMIEFNAIAPTILTKALEGIVVKEARKSGRRKTPGPLVLKRIAETGDIRSAVSSLEFLCLRGDDGDTWSAKVAFTKTKKAKSEPTLTKAEEEALKLISNRESTLGIFHSVGKIVYNKRQDPPRGTELPHPPPWLPQHRRSKVPETDVDRLIDELGTDTATYIAALHENYVLSCSCSSSEESLDSISGCIDSISDADLLSLDRFSTGTRAFSGSATDTLRQDEMSFQAGVRGVLFNLPCPVHRATPANGKKGDSHHMFYPTSLKLWRKKEEVDDLLDLLTAKMQNSSLESSAQAQQRSGGSGVENWKREANDSSSNHSKTAIASAKAEMLMERLPYMARILEASNSSPTLLSQITSVTRVRDTAASATDNNDEEDGDNPADRENNRFEEQWSTDKPDADSSDRLRGTKAKRKVPAGTKTEGGGLGIPVESQVEKLVLEDDDIVDD